MSKPPYRALRIVLGFLCLLIGVAGVLLIFSSKPLVMRMFMHPPESEISTLLLAAVKEMGGLALALSVMLFLATRDPARNVAVIDGMTVGLCILAVTPLVSLYTYLDYYHGSRTHLSLGKDSPEPRGIQPPEMGSLVALPQVGGLHHRYERRAA